MKIYTVGGAVRDALLGLPVQDRDYVVVGATPDDMRARGFTAVGKDFPVFLHPKTHEEYALARTERKTAPGYKGFAFHAAADVTLEQDLSRRDLTINAIAQAEDGNLIDPFNGQQDIADKVFRHVSDAFVEDPVRILRIARFAARLPDFKVAASTNDLMRQMVNAGEVDALVPERVWQELSRGLMEVKPSRMFAVLRDCGALARILPELDMLWGVPQPGKHQPEIDTGAHVMKVIDTAAKLQCSLPIRFAALMHDLGKGATLQALSPTQSDEEAHSIKLVEQVCKRLKISNDCRDLAVMSAREHGNVYRVFALDAEFIVKLFERCDAFRKPQRFADMLRVVECDHLARHDHEAPSFAQAAYLADLLQAARRVDAGAIARQCSEPQKIAESVHEARVAAVAAAMPSKN